MAVDEARLEETVDAMVENALRFTGPDDVIRLPSRRDGQSAVIEVADSGPGIPPENRNRVFERFFQQHARRRNPAPGSGSRWCRRWRSRTGARPLVDTAAEGGALVAIRIPLLSAVAADVLRPAGPVPAATPRADPPGRSAPRDEVLASMPFSLPIPEERPSCIRPQR